VVKPNLRDCWRAASLMWHNASKKVDLEILHLPRARLAALKAAVQGASPPPPAPPPPCEGGAF
jgi:hypothetical protein